MPRAASGPLRRGGAPGPSCPALSLLFLRTWKEKNTDMSFTLRHTFESQLHLPLGAALGRLPNQLHLCGERTVDSLKPCR